jgi:cyclopropane fatty-acyl-phospholipid synthase-like methyltransferase
MMDDNNILKRTFDEVARLYNEIRPRYPEKLFLKLIEEAGLQSDSTLLEIGPGTGQATRPLAKQGFEITAIELGASLADVARYELQEYKNVQIITGAFEEITLSERAFDLVYAATAFHWLEPSVRFVKIHNLLKNGGHLAIIHTYHTSDEKGDAFLYASQPIYDKYDFTDKHIKPEFPRNKDLQPTEIDESLFRLKYFQSFPVVITYSTQQFVKLLNTYSNHLVASQQVQQAFYGEIEALINEEFQGKVEKHFSMALTIAEKI